MKNLIIAIDGHSGCGKSSTAKAVARKLDFTYIDSGAMYRAATLFLMRKNISHQDIDEIRKTLPQINIDFAKDPDGRFATILNNKDVEQEIRSLEISNNVSQYSMVPEVRTRLVELQRKLSQNRNVVMDGRDIGTVVFPDAQLKIFMTADLAVRAKRRQKELEAEGKEIDLEEVLENLESRDQLDTSRKESPLIEAPDAIIIDTTNITLEDQIEMVANLAKDKLNETF